MERRLDRVECKVTRYANVTENVEPLVEVLERLGRGVLSFTLYFQVNISGNRFFIRGQQCKTLMIDIHSAIHIVK